MIAIDAGNTSINFAVFRKDRIAGTFSLPSKRENSLSIRGFLSKYPREDIVLCSVVPEVTETFCGQRRKVCIVGRNITVPMKCLYDSKSIGMDRLVGAFAARKMFPGTRIIIDFGTAITLDFLSEEEAYEGGIILPGIGSTLETFFKCALLPKKIRFKKVTSGIPRNTADSINKGVQEGFCAMVNSLIEKYRKNLRIPRSVRIVITGGDAEVISRGLNFSYVREPFLVLKGLNILYRQSKEY